MKRRITAILLLLCALLLWGCDENTERLTPMEMIPITEPQPDAITITEPEYPAASPTETPPPSPESPPSDEELPPSVEKNGSYTTPEDVAAYIHTFGTLPGNYLTKKDARALGWESSKGNLWDVAPGMSIGGDYFGNYEQQLPEGSYHECDVNYEGGYRQEERLIYGEDGSIYYTNDHYQTFTRLY